MLDSGCTYNCRWKIVKCADIRDGGIGIKWQLRMSSIPAGRRGRQSESAGSTLKFGIQENIEVLIAWIAIIVGGGDGACTRRYAGSIEVTAAVVYVIVGDGWVSGYAVDPTALAASTGCRILSYNAAIYYHI
ncbi:hypothetical protein CEE37_13050 [candidate division LCP-89 bacterium B3_LCP]|uniref:Uncharacterized protein n=1 Tax=candidate division LCP-89 bacterium B3_LCP TaxID=2012998 RepID=A0A532UU22_UNCL8|nr:MAG: hypothetical protein CEE37_13050 [candidate division LCP-89 bacterium B3_LCP]